MNYAKGLVQARTQAGISKRKLASLAGCDASYITHIEAGRKKPSLDILERIADALGVSVALLMLLSSDDDDLRGITSEQAMALSVEFLELLRTSQLPT